MELVDKGVRNTAERWEFDSLCPLQTLFLLFRHVCAALQLQDAYMQKQEEEEEILRIRSEISSMAAARDAAIQREDLAKELISQLQDEVFRLRAQVCILSI